MKPGIFLSRLWQTGSSLLNEEPRYFRDNILNINTSSWDEKHTALTFLYM